MACQLGSFCFKASSFQVNSSAAASLCWVLISNLFFLCEFCPSHKAWPICCLFWEASPDSHCGVNATHLCLSTVL